MGEPRFVVTLVHGTFAPDAPWMREGSKLRNALEAALGRSGEVRFEQFVWRGLFRTRINNGHRYRLEAGERLRRELLEDARPDVTRFIVAHSHGGNVVMYAMRDPEVRRRVAGVVCLATPFIDCEPRPVVRLANYYFSILYNAAAGVVGLTLLVVEAFLLWWLQPTPIFRDYRVGTVSGWSIAFAASLAIYIWMWRRLEPGIVRAGHAWAARTQWQTVHRLALPRAPAPPLFCACADADEAGLLLSVLRRVAETPYDLWRDALYVIVTVLAIGFLFVFPEWLPLYVRDPLAINERLIELFPSLANGPIEYPGWMTWLVSQHMVWRVINPISVGVFAIVVLTIVHLAVMAIWPRLTRAQPIGFGQETIFDNLLARISARPTPQGWTVQQASYSLTVRRGELHHSGLYTDDRVLGDVGAWMVAQAAERL